MVGRKIWRGTTFDTPKCRKWPALEAFVPIITDRIAVIYICPIVIDFKLCKKYFLLKSKSVISKVTRMPDVKSVRRIRHKGNDQLMVII